MKKRSFHLWADSFHEGVWACENLMSIARDRGMSSSLKFDEGFIPICEISDDEFTICLQVLGNYRSWSPRPTALENLLDWGKPDLVLIEDGEDSKSILLAVEETAATPTGNQALQRCERQYGASRMGVPFWYLISEYGIHSDGGIRRDSIWPSIMGVELTRTTGVPSIVLHYSDLENPEDYKKGEGTEDLFKVVLDVLVNRAHDRQAFHGLGTEIDRQLDQMVDFIDATWSESLYFPPGTLTETIEAASHEARSEGGASGFRQPKSGFYWPRRSDFSPELEATQVARTPIKKDALAPLLEASIESGRSYGIIKGGGSKPQAATKLNGWIDTQKRLHADWILTRERKLGSNTFSIELDDFPKTSSGSHHVVTAPRILYLFDSSNSLIEILGEAFPRLQRRLTPLTSDLPALLYISNSVKPGRIFGDPYTGQIASYAVSFGVLSGQRNFFAYFPHQTVAQAASTLAQPENKGLRIMSELTSLLVFGGGYAIRASTSEVL